MCLAQAPQGSDPGEAWTRGLSVSSEALYHLATVLLFRACKLVPSCTKYLTYISQYRGENQSRACKLVQNWTKYLTYTRGVQEIRGQMLPFPQFLTERHETYTLLYPENSVWPVKMWYNWLQAWSNVVVMVTLGRHTRPNVIQRQVDVALSQSDYWLFFHKPFRYFWLKAFVLSMYSPLNEMHFLHFLTHE